MESGVNALYVMADNQKLKQILINIVNNAIKYNRENGAITIECTRSQVSDLKLNPNQTRSGTQNSLPGTPDFEPRTSNPEPETPDLEPGTPNSDPGANIRIHIKDTGNGISPEGLQKLFSPFQRIGAEITEIEGTGLGLTVAKKLIEARKGEIGVASQLEVGSTFWIELPQSKGRLDKNIKLDEQIISDKTLGSGKMLYIEDNISNLELVQQIIEDHRPLINMISDMYGKNAVKMACDYQPGLILLDLNLPDIHGSEVLKLLQANEKTKSIPVVVLSADAMTKQIKSLLTSGARDYLTKPLDIVEFLKVADKFLGKKK